MGYFILDEPFFFHGGHLHPNLVPIPLVHFPSLQQDLLKKRPNGALLKQQTKRQKPGGCPDQKNLL